MSEQRFGVGIVGLQPGRSWGAIAHVPALRSLSNCYDIVGVANTNLGSAKVAAAALQIRLAFADVAELVSHPDVDIVCVTVKVPHHFEVVSSALAAGKMVYCEWPLGNGLPEAEQLANLARARGVRCVVGTQARVSPEIEFLRQLIADGFVGEILSSILIGSGMAWGATIERRNTYLLDRANGATMLTIPLAHTMAGVRDVLGPIVQLSARLLSRRTSATVIGSGEKAAMTAQDQVLVSGVFQSGAPITIHYRGGSPRGVGLLWEIHGTEGDLQVSGKNGHAQMIQLSLAGANGKMRTLQPIDVPQSYYSGWPDSPIIGNVARMYARMAADLQYGTSTAPTFDDAVILHRLVAAVELAAETGLSISLES